MDKKDSLLIKGMDLLVKVYEHFSKADIQLAVEISNYQKEVQSVVGIESKEIAPTPSKSETLSSTQPQEEKKSEFPKNDIFEKPKTSEPKATKDDIDNLWQ